MRPSSSKGHGYLRKSKAYGLVSGIALATTLVTTAVSADEVTTDTQSDITITSLSTATNLTEVQTDNSQAHEDLAAQSGTQTGTITTPIVSGDLNQSVEDAKNVGVIVNQGGSIDYGSLEEANKDLNDQKDTIDTVTDTKKEIDDTLSDITEAAKNSGVTVTEGDSKSYDTIEDALSESKKQVDDLTTITDAQNKINQELPETIESVTSSGVTVTITKGSSYTDAKQALEELANQVASLKQAQTTQTSITEAMSVALAEAQKAGVIISTTGGKIYSDLEEALTAAKTQLATLTAFENTQTEIDNTIKDLTDQANNSGFVIIEGDSKNYDSIEDALADLKDQEAALKQAQENKAAAEATNKANAEAAQKAEDTANQVIQEAASSVNSQGTTVTITGTIKATIEEATALAKELTEKIAAITAANNEKLATYEQQLVELNAKNAAIEAENTRLQTEYDAAYAVYLEELAKYKAALEEYQKKTTTDGYGTEVIEQYLVYKSEPNALMTVIKSDGTIICINSDTDVRVDLKYGESVTVTYTNLENSSYNGKAIGSVIYTYTAGNQDNALHISRNPNTSVTFYGTNWASIDLYGETDTGLHIDSHLDMSIQFFDQQGKLITFTEDAPAAIAFNSLNRSKHLAGTGLGEIVENLSSNIKVVTIAGSSITYDSSTGIIYASGYNDYRTNGSRFDANPSQGDASYWDGTDTRWYGAAVGVVTSGDTISFRLTNNQYNGSQTESGKYYFAFSSDIAAVVETPPTPPNPFEFTPLLPDTLTPPNLDTIDVPTIVIDPEVVAIPNILELHHITLETTVTPITIETTVETPQLEATVSPITINTTVHPVTVTQTPTNEKTVENSDGVDINNQIVIKGSTVSWVLTNNTLLAGRKEMISVVMNDPFPAGFEVDVEATVQANSDYYTLTQLEDGTYQLIGTSKLLSLINANLMADVTLPNFTFIGTPLNDEAHYENTFETIYTTIDGYYKVVSNTPKIDTPPTPNPEKTVTDTSGNNIDGSTVFDKDIIFDLITDYSGYVNTIVDVETMAKSAGIYDDTEDGKVIPDIINATVTDSEGNDITAKGTFYNIEAGQTIPDEIQIFLDGANLTPDGQFIVWLPNNLQDYYQNYVLTGNNVTLHLPVEVIAEAGDTITNTFVQVEFSNGYSSNVVTVTVPDVTPTKTVINTSGEDVNGKEVGLNEVFDYYLEGVTIPENHDTLWQYDLVDHLDTEHDQYTGNFKLIITASNITTADTTLTYEVTAEDGTVYQAGELIPEGTRYHYTITLTKDSEDLNDYATISFEDGIWKAQLNEDFLCSLGTTGTFKAAAYVEVERIKVGDVTNTFTNIVNGKELLSNTVITHTPEPDIVEETPEVPLEEIPVVQQAILPQTGESNSIIALIFGTLLTAFSLISTRRKGKEDKQ